MRRAYQKHRRDEKVWANVVTYFTQRKLGQCVTHWYHVIKPDFTLIEQECRNPPSAACDIIDSEYAELVLKSDEVTQVSFHPLEMDRKLLLT